ncbi:MAG: hypothetical protein WCR82_02520 [Bacteroidales bacterium]
MKFRDIIDSPCGIRYCFDSLELQSGYSRRMLLDSEMMCDRNQIENSYDSLRLFIDMVENNKPMLLNLQFKLQGVRDITGTLESLKKWNVLDDIELFEIKHLAMLGEEVQAYFSGAKYDIEWFRFDLNKVIGSLDPDGLHIGSFYIYDSYSEALREMRKEYKNNLDDEVLRIKIDDEENRIRKVISGLLYSYSDDLTILLHSLARIDILISKAIQIKKEGMCLPKLAMKSSYKGMFNPEVKFILSKAGKKFQKIDFSHDFGVPTTIIGANMGGKTVVLKTLALCQYMFQFGFGVPADESNMTIFDEIHFCIGDEQSEHKGLSSFAAEMLRIDNVLKSVKREIRLFALIDEPARTTNPIEGRALVSALLKILYGKKNLDLVMTTHYNVDNGEMCWRVKGLIDGKMNYSLLRTKSNEVPHEALNIAAELGIDQLWLEEAKHYLFNL